VSRVARPVQDVAARHLMTRPGPFQPTDLRVGQPRVVAAAAGRLRQVLREILTGAVRDLPVRLPASGERRRCNEAIVRGRGWRSVVACGGPQRRRQGDGIVRAGVPPSLDEERRGAGDTARLRQLRDRAARPVRSDRLLSQGHGTLAV